MMLVSLVMLMFVLASCGKTAGQAVLTQFEIEPYLGDTVQLRTSWKQGDAPIMPTTKDVQITTGAHDMDAYNHYTRFVIEDAGEGYVYFRTLYQASYVSEGNSIANVPDDTLSKQRYLCGKSNGGGYLSTCNGMGKPTKNGWDYRFKLDEVTSGTFRLIHSSGKEVCQKWEGSEKTRLLPLCTPSTGSLTNDVDGSTYSIKVLKDAAGATCEGEQGSKQGNNVFKLSPSGTPTHVCVDNKWINLDTWEIDLKLPEVPSVPDCVSGPWNYKKEGKIIATYTGCTKEYDSKYWCATEKGAADGTYTSGGKENVDWKYCSEAETYSTPTLNLAIPIKVAIVATTPAPTSRTSAPRPVAPDKATNPQGSEPVLTDSANEVPTADVTVESEIPEPETVYGNILCEKDDGGMGKCQTAPGSNGWCKCE